jgi:alpha-L-rhamnosidase
VTIPANTTATLHLLLPTLDYVVEESGKAAVKAEGVSSVTFMNGKAVELQSGTYQFVVKKENK